MDCSHLLGVRCLQGPDIEVVNIVPGFAAYDSNQFDIGDLVLTIDNVPVLFDSSSLPYEMCHSEAPLSDPCG